MVGIVIDVVRRCKVPSERLFRLVIHRRRPNAFGVVGDADAVSVLKLRVCLSIPLRP